MFERVNNMAHVTWAMLRDDWLQDGLEEIELQILRDGFQYGNRAGCRTHEKVAGFYCCSEPDITPVWMATSVSHAMEHRM
jgi:hypothetical protein